MSHWIPAALLLLWSVFGVAAGAGDQPRLAATDTADFSAAVALPADELPDDLAVDQPAAPLWTTRAHPAVEPGDFVPLCGPAVAHRARGPPGVLPA